MPDSDTHRPPARRGGGIAGAFVALAWLAGLACLGPLIWRADPLRTDLAASLQPPSLAHPLGTDGCGRDLLARLIRGAGISLGCGLIIAAASGFVGIPLGLFAAGSGGLLDSIIMRSLDVLLAFPQLVLAMAVSIGLGSGLASASLGIGLGCIPVYARLARSEALRLGGEQFVAAARTLGLSEPRIALRHVLPLMLPTLLVQGAAVFGATIVSLSALGFVGLGARVPTPEWGVMIADGMAYALSGGWWISFWPGLAIFVAVAASNLLADHAGRAVVAL
jgi:peptide/nickel transport system permease protein